MNKAIKQIFITVFLGLTLTPAVSAKNKSKDTSESLPTAKADYLTINEAINALKIPDAAAKLNTTFGVSPELPEFYRPPFTSIEPIKLFDNFYFVGTTSVGLYIAQTDEGLVLFDTGGSEIDAALMTADMKKLGLDPSTIKLIFISHEHFDHYGGVQYFKKNVCPEAKVAMSLIGWNMLQTVPLEGPYVGARPQSVDIFLTDGMKIKVGKTIVQIVSTPGHSAGCMSFIIPVTDNGEPHMVGLMGGSAVFPTQLETRLYKTSIEYFKAFAITAKCDIGLGYHYQEANFSPLRHRKTGEPNPLIIGTEKFDSVYLKQFRDKYQEMLDSGKLKPY